MRSERRLKPDKDLFPQRDVSLVVKAEGRNLQDFFSFFSLRIHSPLGIHSPFMCGLNIRYPVYYMVRVEYRDSVHASLRHIIFYDSLKHTDSQTRGSRSFIK